jgi:hypothetical protein
MGDERNFDDSKLIEPPSDLNRVTSVPGVLSVRFLSKSDFVLLPTHSHYAVLFNGDSPWPRRYLDLLESPFPSTFRYDRNASIDSAPAAHILVTGQRDSGGINVYRYDPDKQTLKRIWAPTP